MYSRIFNPQLNKSYFLFGPRGTGKTTWVKKTYPHAIYIDLLNSEIFNNLLPHPERLSQMIPKDFKDWIVIDEVQRIPELLHEVHRLIEAYHYKFILTGSSARKLRKQGVNLLAGRALRYHFYPLTVYEIGNDFSLPRSVLYGHLPSAVIEKDPKEYLESYVYLYIDEEVRQEGLVRNIGSFYRFLETASLSQGSVLNVSEIARDAGVERKVVENYFTILEDLRIAYRLPVFSKHAKRRLLTHRKFYFFDTGVYRIIRPKGPLDESEIIDGATYETLFLQELYAINEYKKRNYKIYYYRTADGVEVDFILYGEKGLLAFEIKRSDRVNKTFLSGLKLFKKDYPSAQCYFVYGGNRKLYIDDIEVWPMEEMLKNLHGLI